MPKINPAIMVWARETAGLTQEEAAKKLAFRDSSKSSAVEKLARIERGQQEPTRPQLVKMAGQYRRPLLTFYLSKPPQKGDRGVDFRTLPQNEDNSEEALLDALIREIRARQSMVRVIMEEEDEAEPLPLTCCAETPRRRVFLFCSKGIWATTRPRLIRRFFEDSQSPTKWLPLL